jgi:hypothetical protein
MNQDHASADVKPTADPQVAEATKAELSDEHLAAIAGGKRTLVPAMEAQKERVEAVERLSMPAAPTVHRP